MQINDRRFKDAFYEQWARIGKALASPKRLELLDLLAQSPRTVEALARESSMTVANVSQHLQALRAAGLVISHKKGLYVTCQLADPKIASFLRSLRLLAERRIVEIEHIARDFMEKRETLEAVDRRQLLKRAQTGTVTVLDVRPHEEYLAGHIPGALSVPLNELRQRLKELPKNQIIVAYCRGPYCILAFKAVKLLKQHGLRAVRLADGIPDWRAQGLPVAVGE